jgi:hypothetical protein
MSIRTAKALVTILALAGLFALASAAAAATYLVRPNGSGDYATIQDAIDGVVDTDIIELADGTFVRGHGEPRPRLPGQGDHDRIPERRRRGVHHQLRRG